MLGVVTGRAWGDLTLKGKNKPCPIQQTHVRMGGAVVQPPKMGEIAPATPPQPPKKPEPKPEPKMGKIVRPEPLMGDISAD
jgi:hypothetical protein